jgi:hypothetical protein
MKQTIKFIYTSEYTDQFAGHCGTPRIVEFALTNEPSMPELVEQFELFIKAMGYFPPDNSHLDWVEEDPPV